MNIKKRSKLEKVLPVVLGTCMLTFIAACGSDDDDDSSAIPQEQEETEVAYRAVLTPVNPTVGSATTPIGGIATVTRLGDDFQVNVVMENAPSAIHMQHIHTGSACAGLSANDANNDGYLDMQESMSVIGSVLIPLDDDLSGQDAGNTSHPFGNYNYSESTSWALMLADLRLPDTNTEDNVVKLGATDELSLEGRVVEVHGVPDSTTLPATVASGGGETAHRTLPIACGVLTKVEVTTPPETPEI